MSAYESTAKESIDSKDIADYTVHHEPADQGGETYARCRGCGREILPVGRFDKLTHPEECPFAGGDPLEAGR